MGNKQSFLDSEKRPISRLKKFLRHCFSLSKNGTVYSKYISLIRRYGSKERINEFSMFENVNIKEKINKFSTSLEPTNLSLSKQKAISLRQNPMKYGGSCNNLLASFSPNQSTDAHNKSSSSQHSTADSTADIKNSTTSDSDASNDDSCSDYLTSASLSEDNLPVQPQLKNNIHITNIQIDNGNNNNNNRALIPPK